MPVTLEPAGLTDLITVEAVAPAGSTAYKLPATLHETPRSLTIIDSARMREQDFHSVPDALAYVPGIFVNSYRTEGYHFYARGYRMGPEDTRIDGFAGINAGGGFGASLFGVEQAVVIRGPAGLLYGSAGSAARPSRPSRSGAVSTAPPAAASSSRPRRRCRSATALPARSTWPTCRRTT